MLRVVSPRLTRSTPVYALMALTALVAGGSAAAQVHITIDPVMTKGPAEAPVTIVEFSDYQ